jgi:hypothetical protein
VFTFFELRGRKVSNWCCHLLKGLVISRSLVAAARHGGCVEVLEFGYVVVGIQWQTSETSWNTDMGVFYIQIRIRIVRNFPGTDLTMGTIVGTIDI